MKLKPGKWESVRELFASRNGYPPLVFTSGGRTSAMMAALAPESSILCFQNTGLEHPGTYKFLERLEDALGREIVWLEYVKPARKGGAPREACFKQVTASTASRDGRPLLDMMEALAEYRATKGLPPVAPWARSRICTAYLKLKTATKWAKATGVKGEELVGLRADEPERVARLRGARAPLYDAGITKNDVLLFWKQQSFDLEIADYQGNCTGCFLKDQSDLARSMNEPHSQFEVWKYLETHYRQFGGRDFRGYSFLKSEGPLRLQIEAALREGREPVNDGSMEDRRFKLVVIQERKRIQNLLPSFSCNCEGAETLAAFDEDDEDEFWEDDNLP